MKGLDFSKFKKISDHDTHTIFRNDQGHELKVAKKGLNPKLRKQMDAIKMAGGGVAPAALQSNDNYQDDSVNTGVPGININVNPQNMTPAPSSDQSPESREDYSSITGGKSGFDKTMESVVGDHPWMAGPQMGPNGERQGALSGYLPQDGQQAAPAEMPTTDAGQVATNGNPLDAVAPPPGTPDAATAQPQGGQPQPAAAQPKTFDQHKDEIKNQMVQEDQHMQHDLDNGHITPKTYHDLFAKKDTLGKIGTIFGMMLSGMGSGLTGQPNMLLQMMNKEIDNDLESQKSNQTAGIENKRVAQQGLYNQAQIKHLGAETQIQQAAYKNMMMNRAAVHSLAQAVNQYPVGSPQRIKAEQTLAGIAGAVNMENANIADVSAANMARMRMLTGMDMGGGGQQSGSLDAQVGDRLKMLRVMDPQRAAELEKRYVPGVGVSNVEVPQKVREDLVSKQSLLDAGKNLLDYSKTHSNIVPGTPEYNYGVAKSMAFQQKVREGLLGTVFRESEKPLLEKFVGENPAGAFKRFSTDPKLRAILDTTELSLNTLKKTAGLPESVPRGTNQSSGSMEGKTASDGRGNKIVMQNGRWVPVNNVAKK